MIEDVVSERKRRRAARKVKPGDGHALERFRWWQPLSRSLFHLDIAGEDGQPRKWSVENRLWADSHFESYAQPYRD